ncbi:MAG: DUF3368 domain-containing protein [Chloroflexota bacterium]
MPGLEPVVSNTTPLITLAGVGLINVLPALYGKVWIPDVVYEEYRVGQGRDPARPDLDHLPWLLVHPIAPDSEVTETLDAGEAAAIALARACHARLILLDEQRGRREAARLGLPVAGSLAVLIAAKEQGLISAVAPILDQIMAQGRWVGVDLRARVLGLAGEEVR